MDVFDRPMALAFGRNFRGGPIVDMKEDHEKYMIEAELPGYKKEDINIHFDANRLELESSKSESKHEKKAQEGFSWIINERSHENFSRIFQFEDRVLADKIDASFKDGVLTITVPKAEPEKKNIMKIDVKEIKE